MQQISQNLFVVPSMPLMQKLTLHQKLACMSKFLAAIYPQIQLEESEAAILWSLLPSYGVGS